MVEWLVEHLDAFGAVELNVPVDAMKVVLSDHSKVVCLAFVMVANSAYSMAYS